MAAEEKATWVEARDAEAAKTGTRSPVALFQARELVTIEDGWGNGGDYGTSLRGTAAVRTASEIVHADDGGWRWVSDGETLTPDELVEARLAVSTWWTLCVLLNRADGERYGQRHGHDYPDGWRVCPVPAEYDLEELLAQGAGWKGFGP